VKPDVGGSDQPAKISEIAAEVGATLVGEQLTDLRTAEQVLLRSGEQIADGIAIGEQQAREAVVEGCGSRRVTGDHAARVNSSRWCW
jgi:hypothetical protein